MDTLIWDILALIWLLVFLVQGARRGLILTLGSLCVTVLGFAAGYWAAGAYGPQLAEVLEQSMSESSQLLSTVLSSAILFFGGYLLVRLVGRWALKALNKVGKLPVLGCLNRLGGGVLGLLRGAVLLLILGQLLVLIGLIPGDEALAQTTLARYFLTGFL